MNIMLVGGSGVDNYGDELMLRLWLRYLDEHHPNSSVWVEGNSLAGVQKSVGLFSGDGRASDILLMIAAEKNEISFFEHVERGIRFIKDGAYKKHPKMRDAQSFLKDCDVFHLHGGGYVSQHWPNYGFLFGIGVGLKNLFKTKFVCTGLGVTPLPGKLAEDKKVWRKILNFADVFGVRDPFGVVAVTSEVWETPFQDLDDAFLYEVKQNKLYYPERKILHVAVDDASLLKDPQLMDKIKKKAEGADKTCVWDCSPDFNQKSTKEIFNLGFDTEKMSLADLHEKGIPYASAHHCLFTSKYHPALQVARMGGEVVSHFSDAYDSHKHRSIHALGSQVKSEDQTLLKKRDRALQNLKQIQAEWIYANGNL